jgi:cystathionine beta-lyase/cystathionine gamma-synthase
MPASVSINQAGEYSSTVDFGVSPRLIRLFVGLEDPEELWSDLSKAIAGA